MGRRDGWTSYPIDSKKAPIHQDHQLKSPTANNMKFLWSDFINTIETKSRPVCDIESGHLSTNMALLGMMFYKLQRSGHTP